MGGIRLDVKIWGLTDIQRDTLISELKSIFQQIKALPNAEWEVAGLWKFDEGTTTVRIETNVEQSDPSS